jgi:hypothetical protein
MANDDRIAIWTKVPDGSSIRISAKGTTSKNLVTAHAFLLRGDGVEQTIPDNLIQPGPVEIPLEAKNRYSILLDLVYTTSGTGEVRAEMIGPDNKSIPADGTTDKQFQSTLPGSQGQTLGVTFFVIMAKK